MKPRLECLQALWGLCIAAALRPGVDVLAERTGAPLTHIVPGWALGLWLLAAGWLLVLVHELGHTLAGWVAGCRLQRLTAGPLQVQRTGWNWQPTWQVWSGWAVLVPQELDGLVHRTLLVAAGGLGASLLAGVGLLLAAWAAGSARPVTGVLLGTAGLLSLGLFAANALPCGRQEWVSDGMHIWRLLRRDRDRWAAQAALSALLESGVPAAELPGRLLTEALRVGPEISEPRPKSVSDTKRGVEHASGSPMASPAARSAAASPRTL